MGHDCFVCETQYRLTSRKQPEHSSHINRTQKTTPNLFIWEMTPSYLRHKADTQAGDGPNILNTSTGTRQLRQYYVYGTWLIRVWDTIQTHTQETAQTSSPRQQEEDNGAQITYTGHGAFVFETPCTHIRRRRPEHPPQVNRTKTTAPELYIWDMTHLCIMLAHTQEAARASAARQLDEDIGAITATPTPHQQWERCPK